MSKRDKSNKKKFIQLIIVTILVAVLSAVYFNIDRILGRTKTENTLDDSAVAIENADLTIHFIDVGQGDSVFIELPDDTTMLIDAGKKGKGSVVQEYIETLGYTQIDYLIVTHGDDDHVGGIPTILDEFEVKNIYRPYQFAVKDGVVNSKDDLKSLYTEDAKNIITNQPYNTFIEKAYVETYMDENNEVQEAIVSTHYDTLKILPVSGSDFTIEFFGPLRTVNGQNFEQNDKIVETIGYPSIYYGSSNPKIKNSASCVMLLEYNDGSYLFTGDAIDLQEKALINSLTSEERQRFSEVELYHVAHHGSRDSSCAEFLELIKPKMSIISVGEGNTYEHPHAEAVDRIDDYSGDNIYRTDIDGNILILANEEDIQLKTNTKLGNLSSKISNIDPQKEWYIYVAGITLFVFISGVIYIVRQNINAKKRSAKYRR